MNEAYAVLAVGLCVVIPIFFMLWWRIFTLHRELEKLKELKTRYPDVSVPSSQVIWFEDLRDYGPVGDVTSTKSTANAQDMVPRGFPPKLHQK